MIIKKIFGRLREGNWWLVSKSDPRWNYDGSAKVGRHVMPKECKQKIKELKTKFGKPPHDLKWGYMRYSKMY